MAPNSTAEVGAGFVVAHEDDLLGAEPPGRQHRQQADRAVPDDRHRGARVHVGPLRGVVAGAIDISQGQQGWQQRGVLTGRQLDQGAGRLRHPDRFGLGLAEEPAIGAGGLHALAAELAGVVLVGEGGHDQVAALETGHLRAEFLDGAHELMAHGGAMLGGWHAVVRVQVAAADTAAHYPHDRVGGLLQHRVGHVLNPHIAGTVHQGCPHEESLRLLSPVVRAASRAGR